MNILYLNNSVHLGGDTKCILKLCKEFKKKNNVIMASNGGEVESEFRKLGIKHFKINDVENKSLVNMLANYIKIRKMIKTNNIDIIHSHHRMTTLIARLACKLTNIKVIHTQHSCIDNKFKLTRFALNNIDVISVSNQAKKILVEKCKMNSEKITTIYNSIEVKVNVETVDSRLVELKRRGHFIVCQVSRVIDYKGVYDFVKIARETIKSNNNIRFVLIGDGPESERLQQYIINQDLREYVLLLGSKCNVIDHLKFIDVFILCSYIEGLPLTPIEAFSQKIPVIGTNIGGTNEEIVDGVNGYLIKTKDINGFKDKILYLYNNRDILSTMGNEAYIMYLNKFNEIEYIEEHDKIYTK